MRISLILVVMALSVGCGRVNVGNGQLRCSVPDQQCPDGFHCATDGTCWKNGQGPAPSNSDMAVGDAGDSKVCTFEVSAFDDCTIAP